MKRWNVDERAEGEMRTMRRFAATIAIALLLLGGTALFAAEYDELKSELAPRFRAIDLSDGVLFEPLPEFDDLPVVEISDRELWIDGAPATGSALRRLGELGPAIRKLAEEHGVEIPLETSPMEPEPMEAPAAPESPELPHEEKDDRVIHKDDQVVVGGDLIVKEHEIARDVVVLGGKLTILGRVDGEAVVVGGSADIQGEVDGDVAVIGGAIEIGPNAEIRGSVEAVGGGINAHESSRIEGEINEVSFGPGLRLGRWIEEYAKGTTEGDRARVEEEIRSDVQRDYYDSSHRGSRIGGWILRFMVLVLFGSLSLLFFQKPIDRMAEQARVEPAKSGLVGLVAQILAVPLLLVTIVVLAISVIGIPLIVLLPVLIFVFVFVGFLGFVAVAVQIGRFLRDRFDFNIQSVFLLLIVGLLAILGWGLLGGIFGAMGRFFGFFAVMFTVFGVLANYAAATVGLGAALITRAGTLTASSTPLFSGGFGRSDGGYAETDAEAAEGTAWVEQAARWDDDELSSEDAGEGEKRIDTREDGLPDLPPRDPED